MSRKREITRGVKIIRAQHYAGVDIYDSVVEKGAIRAPLSDTVSQSESLGRSYRRTSSLGYLVHLLWQLDLTPGDILVYAGPLPWRSANWTRFQCEVPHCPYAMMLKARLNVLEETHKEK